jgi:putative PIN family toxin of toxin-antitoxin system
MSIPSVVLDTNIVVSAHLSPLGLEYRVLKLCLDRRLGLFLSAPILDEYETVLRRPKFPLVPEKITDSLAQMRRIGTLVAPAIALAVSPDERDNRFLECAETAGADFLATGNRRHYPSVWKVSRIVNARESLDSILDL